MHQWGLKSEKSAIYGVLTDKNQRVFFKYSKDPKKLTSQIERLTNYKQRKINLESRIKKLEKSDLNQDLKELNMLKQKHTLGKVNFDSIIIIDFGSGLKGILTSLAYTDVLDLFVTGKGDTQKEGESSSCSPNGDIPRIASRKQVYEIIDTMI